MRAHTNIITNLSRRSRQRRSALALAIGVCALAIPSSAGGQPGQEPVGNSPENSGYTSPDSIIAASGSEHAKLSGSTGSSVDSSYQSPDSVIASTGEPVGSSGLGVDSVAPSLASSSPSSADDGFEMASALIGAGAALALTALAGAAMITVRKRNTVSPAAS